MEGLKPMVNKAMGDPFTAPKGTMPGDHMSTKDMALHDAKAMVAMMGGTAIVNIGDDDEPVSCDMCGKWIEPGNTGTVCGACTQSMLGIGASMGPGFQPLSTYAGVGPETNVGLGINGHNLHVTVFRSLSGLADDIRGSMTPEEIHVLVSQLMPPEPPKVSSALPDEFWQAIEAGAKIRAIKELKSASELNLKSSKDIVNAIMDGYDKDYDESEDKDKDKSDDKDESEDSEDKDKDDNGDEPEDSEPGDGEDGDSEEGPSAGEGAGADDGDGQEGDGADDGGTDTGTADALAELAKRAHDNGKEHSEDEIRKALQTLGIQF